MLSGVVEDGPARRLVGLVRLRAGEALAVAVPRVARGDALRVEALGVVALRVVALRVAGRVRVVADEAAAAAAMLRTILLSSSRRFIAFCRSACLAVRSSRVSTCLIAVWMVFWPSLTVRSICLRTSGGSRLCA